MSRPVPRWVYHLRPPLTLAAYARRSAIVQFVIWLVILLLLCGPAFNWLADGKLLDRGTVTLVCLWAGFFVGFVATCSGTLATRRKLLTGRLEPTRQEWRGLETEPARSLAGSFWLSALVAACLAAVALAGLHHLLGLLGARAEQPRPAYLFYTVLMPALIAALASHRAIRSSAARFVSAIERHPPLVLPRHRYLLLHNVVPYAVFNTAMSLAVAFARFARHYRGGLEVDASELVTHLTITALVIALFAVSAARLKTRVDFLSPIVLDGAGALRVRWQWRVVYSLLVPLVTFGALRAGLWACGVVSLRPGAAICVKVGVCLTIALVTAWWAVTSIQSHMEAQGQDQHPFVRLHRVLRRVGYFSGKTTATPA